MQGLKSLIRGSGTAVQAVSVAQMGEPLLRQRSLPLTKSELALPETKSQIALMWQTMEAEAVPDVSLPVGLAAPQIRWMKRVVTLVCDPLPRTVLINPKLTVKRAGEHVLMEESCISVKGLVGAVKRAKHVSVEFWDEEGTSRTLHCAGWYAGLLQHELDHLDGVLFVDRVDTRMLAFADLWDRKLYPTLCNPEDGTFSFT